MATQQDAYAAERAKAFAHLMEIINHSELNMEKAKHNTTKVLPVVAVAPQDLSGKVIVITGANVGIGYETTKAVASMNPKKIIMACRSVAKAETAKTEIENTTGFKNIEVWEIDLASFASVKAFTKKFNDSGLPLDLLVSNAGLVSPGWIETADGYEITQQVNHLANVLLVLELTPALRKAPSSRVVVVASDVHYWATGPQPEDPTPVKTTLTKPAQVHGFLFYPISKLYNILFAQEYARRAPKSNNTWICSANPGYTESELGAKDPASGDFKGHNPGMPGMVKRPTAEGAKSIIFSAIAPNVGASGGFYSEVEETTPRSSTLGESGAQFGARVWKDTIGIIKPHLSVTDEWIFN